MDNFSVIYKQNIHKIMVLTILLVMASMIAIVPQATISCNHKERSNMWEKAWEQYNATVKNIEFGFLDPSTDLNGNGIPDFDEAKAIMDLYQVKPDELTDEDFENLEYAKTLCDNLNNYCGYTIGFWKNHIIIEWPTGGTLTAAFEDLPIGTGNDFDYNDWIVDINTEALYTKCKCHSNCDCHPGCCKCGPKLMAIKFVFVPEARGAGYNHLWGFSIPANTFPGNGHYIITFYDENGTPTAVEDGEFIASVDNNFTVIEWTKDALPPNEGEIFTNTVQEDSYVKTKIIVKLVIMFDNPVEFDLNDYDPYSAGNVHAEELFFNPYLHVCCFSNTKHYTVDKGDLRVITVPVDWLWPREIVPIWDAYDDVTCVDGLPEYAENWWENYNIDLVYIKP